eukprot:scaffold147811_cov62-Cyclotella_meneghiniana.AAC.1
MQQDVEKRKDEVTRESKNRLNIGKVKINKKKKNTKPLDDDDFVDYLSSDSEAGEDPIPDITRLKLSHDEVINKTSFGEGYFVTPGAHHFHDSVVDDSMDTDPTNRSQDGTSLNQHYRRQARFTFATILDIIQGAIGGFMNYEAF